MTPEEPSWINALAHLLVYLMGVVICYGAVAFVYLTPVVSEFTTGGRFLFVLLLAVWTYLFIDAATKE